MADDVTMTAAATTTATATDSTDGQRQDTPTRALDGSRQEDDQEEEEQQQQLAMDEEIMDEETLKRILACKRLSEGCNRFSVGNFICRKNSLHLFGDGLLPPVTEGEPMRHMSHHLSQNFESSSSSSLSSASLRQSTGGGGGRHMGAAPGSQISKRNSQDDNTASCSSSTSLDGPRSPSRRRSSTVSQCSSVLSEGTRQQLNFDLSPDLAPDSSILEANAISPTDFDRPASPEPCSLGSGSGNGGSANNNNDEFSFNYNSSSCDMMRPMSRMSSQLGDDSMLATSPDSTLGDCNDSSNFDSFTPQQAIPSGGSATINREQQLINHQPANSETTTTTAAATTTTTATIANETTTNSAKLVEREKYEATIRDNLERIISNVSAVKVSPIVRGAANCSGDELGGGGGCNNYNSEQQQTLSLGLKRAHTPFDSNLQRNKTSLISSTPSPTI